MKPKFYLSKALLYRLWILALLVFPILILYPISYRLIRLAIVFLGVAILLGTIYLFRRPKIIRVGCITLSILTLIFLVSPGWQVSGDTLRKDYVQELSQYEGTRYVWGGTSKFGIDCSGLVRQSLIQANIKQGLLTLNSDLIRYAIVLWWNPAAIDALIDRYHNYTKINGRFTSINQVDYAKIKPGDLAATVDKVHILAYLGNQTWIEADPTIHKVIKVHIPEPKNYWFNTPVFILQWQEFYSETIALPLSVRLNPNN
jgi:hypothetical protein